MESDARKDDDLEQHTRMLEKILQHAADGICVCHNIPDEPHVRFTHWNPQMVAITGYTMDEINRLGWYQTMYPDIEVQKAAVERMARMRAGDHIQGEEWTITRKDGEKRCLCISTSIIAEEDGKVHVLAVMHDVSERKQVEEELRSNEALLEGVLNGLRDVVGIQLPDHTMVRYNKAGYDLLGLSPDEVIGRKCYELIGRVKPCDICATRDAVQTKQIQAVENFVPELGRHFLCTSNPILRPDGEIELIVEQLTDITDRRIQEDALRESEKNLKTLFDNIEDFLFVFDLEGRIFRFNRVVLQRLGYSPDELLGMPVPQVHPPDRREDAARIIADILAGKTSECLVPLMSKSGRLIPVETRVTRGTWNGQPVLFGICRDITERIEVQDALRESEKKYRTLFENAPIGIAIVDSTSNVLDANDAMFRLHGLRRQERMPIIITGDYYWNRGDWEKTRVRLFQDGFLNEWEVRLKKGNGTPYDALVTMRPIEIRGNSLWLAMIQDITEQKQREQALNESLKEKELLLREIHHRVKNNMQIITSLLRLQSSKATHPEIVDIMDDCQSRIRAIALVHETLYHSQALSHIGLLEYLQSLTGSVMQTYLHAAPIAVRVSVAPTDMTLHPDKAIPFGLVISELLTNALKHAFPDGRSEAIAINAHRIDDRQLEVTVSDDGVGFPENLDVRKTDSLGLELVTGLVERQLDGAIEWRVQNGTVFTIRFIP